MNDETKFENSNRPVALSLSGAKVSAGFRAALFDAANKYGMSVNQFTLEAAGAFLKAAGYEFPDVFPLAPGQKVETKVYPYRYVGDESGMRLADKNGALIVLEEEAE